MKSLEEIQGSLIEEIKSSIVNIPINSKLDYYNELLGDVSFLLAGYLHVQLKQNYKDWDSSKWIDDSLITKVNIDSGQYSFWGVMIWGVENTTEQWTDPFYFTVLFEDKDYIPKCTLLFGDSNCAEITYEEFNSDRNYWDEDYYSSPDWHPYERDWKYIINSNNQEKFLVEE